MLYSNGQLHHLSFLTISFVKPSQHVTSNLFFPNHFPQVLSVTLSPTACCTLENPQWNILIAKRSTHTWSWEKMTSCSQWLQVTRRWGQHSWWDSNCPLGKWAPQLMGQSICSIGHTLMCFCWEKNMVT